MNRSSEAGRFTRSANRAVDGFPHSSGRAGQVDVADAEVRERVDHRTLNRWGGTDRSALTDSLCPEIVEWRRRLEVHGHELQELGGGRKAVVGEIAGERIAVGVVHDFFEERLRDTLHQAAVHLAFSEQRVEDAAGIVDGHQ